MEVADAMIGKATEGAVLKFVLSLYELAHPGEDAVKVAVELLEMDKGAFIQHRDGKGSIGFEGWQRLSERFDLRPFDIWTEHKRIQYRRSNGTDRRNADR